MSEPTIEERAKAWVAQPDNLTSLARYEWEKAYIAGARAENAACAAIVEAVSTVEANADDTVLGLRRGEPYRKLAAAIRARIAKE